VSNFSKSEKEIYELRKQKIAFLNEISSDSFPTKFNESTKISNIINEHRDIEEGIHTGISVTIRGRLLNARSFGKLLFYDILDQSGKIQLLVNSGEIEDIYLRLFENFDIGDIIAVNGEVIKTKKGEHLPVFVHSHHIHQHEKSEQFGVKSPIYIDHLVCF